MIHIYMQVRYIGLFWSARQLFHPMAVATIEADEAVASSVFVQIMGTSLKKTCWSGSFWSFLVTSPRLILRSGYRDASVNIYIEIDLVKL